MTEISWASERNFDIVSVVLTHDPVDQPTAFLDQVVLEDIEASLDASINLSQVVTNAGGGAQMSDSRNQRDVTLVRNRVEFRSLDADFSSDAANRIFSLYDEVIARVPPRSWTSIGYNYVVSLRTEGAASERMLRSLARDDLDVGYPVIGMTAWIWVQMEEGPAWIRLEPHRSSQTTERLTANANLTVELDSGNDPPDRVTLRNMLLQFGSRLNDILGALEL